MPLFLHISTGLRYCCCLAFFLLANRGLMAQLKADFTMSQSGGCSPLSITFTNTSTGTSSNTIYSWDFGNGNSAAIANPGAIYTEEKTYTVTLTIKDGSQTASTTKQVTVYKKPTADFTASTAKECMPKPITFTSTADAGSGTISNYYWDFGDGNTQQGSGNSISHSYALVQKATVSLTVTNSFGCYHTISKKDIVDILPTLTASFSADKRILCRESDPVQFTNSSTGPGTLSYTWDFGDGATSNAVAPSHVFNKKGIYTVGLTVKSSEGCVAQNTQTGYLNVANYSTDFDAPVKACKNDLVTFINRGTPSPNYSTWSVDGQVYAYNNPYLYYQLRSAGTHTVTLTNTYGTCTESVLKQIQVNDVPDLRGFIAQPAGFCGAPMAVSFKDTTPGAVKWNWSFWTNINGDGSTLQAPSYTYNSDGVYSVFLEVTNADGCKSSILKSVAIPKPYVYITYTSSTSPSGLRSCGPLTVGFMANSSEPITQYKWAFGDGSSSTDPEPSHTFSTPGNYTIRLDYVTQNGCTGTAYYNEVVMNTMPKMDIVASETNSCVGSTIIFSVTPAQPGVYSYLWETGDGGVWSGGGPNGQYPHSYKAAGTYTIKLTARNSACDTVITKTDLIKINPPQPVIAATTRTCEGARGEITFTHASVGADNITWDFGDGNTLSTPGSQLEVKHTYTRSGIFPVKLTATANQCTANMNSAVTVYLKQQPTLTAMPPQICAERPLTYTISNLERNPFYVTWYDFYYFKKWEYDDGTEFTGTRDYYIDKNGLPFTGNLYYPDKSKTRIRAIVEATNSGCPDTTNFVVYSVQQGPQAGFEVLKDDQCFKETFMFRDTSKSFGSTIQSREWNFGDGFTSGQAGTVSHTYNSPGSYYVTLRVTDASGCTTSTGSFSKLVKVNGPKASFYTSETDVPLNTTVNFTNTTNTYNSPGTAYRWDFGNGVSSTQANPSYTFTTPGTYIVKMTATDPVGGCSSDAQPVTIIVRDFVPAFSFNTSTVTGRNCPPVLIRFTNNSINAIRVTWDFGDGITADNLYAPSHVYEKPGRYTVTLYVYGANGLTATHKREIIITQPEATMQADVAEGCIGHTPTLSALAKNTSRFTWDLGDGTVLTTTDTFTKHTYRTPGIYTPLLLMSDANGCTSASAPAGKIIIRPDPVVNINPAQPLICLGASTKLEASGGATYEWTPVTGLSAANIAAPMASPVNTTDYKVVVKDDIGCSSTGAVTVTVVQPQKILVSPDAEVCYGNSVTLTASGADLYNWIFNTSGLSNTNIANPVAKPLVNTTYTIRGTDKHNCFSDTAQVRVTVRPLPTVELGADVEVMAGTPVQMSPVYSTDVVSWSWTPAQYLSCGNCPAPLSKPMSQTKYTLTVGNQYGCKASDSMLIKMFCEESRVAIPNAFSPNNDGVNDVWMIKGISLIKHLVIFNRWGQKVFERSNFIASDRASCWDGIFNGYPAPPGTYVYLIEMECPSGGPFMKKGTVILTR